jgi:microcystin-dependent protein
LKEDEAMSEPFIGEIRMFAGTFAPRGNALCDGQLLLVSQHDALFSLLGTTYGGDGRTTFGLPDLRGRLPIHMGQGPGLSNRRIGARGGAEQVTVTVNQLPVHTHTARATNDEGTLSDPTGAIWAGVGAGVHYVDGGTLQAMHANALTSVGGSQSHFNVMPFQCINFIIALWGIYPSRA